MGAANTAEYYPACCASGGGSILGGDLRNGIQRNHLESREAEHDAQAADAGGCRAHCCYGVAQQRGLKVYISADMEGIGGVSTWDVQASSSGREYEKFRRLMTEEVNTAIAGAFDAGATDVLVSESHGDAQNIDVELLDKRVRLIHAWPRPLAMMEGVNDSFAAAAFVGYHASEWTTSSLRAISRVTSRRVDGQRWRRMRPPEEDSPPPPADKGGAILKNHFGMSGLANHTARLRLFTTDPSAWLSLKQQFQPFLELSSVLTKCIHRIDSCCSDCR
jgi:hypothetical protein